MSLALFASNQASEARAGDLSREMKLKCRRDAHLG